MTVLLGSLAAVFFGIGDLLGGVGVRKAKRPGSHIAMAFVATGVGTIVIGVYLLILPPESVTSSDLWWSVLAGLSMSITRPLLYLGMARGPISVFSPSFALVAIVVPALIGPFVDQNPTGFEICGLVVAIPAVVLLSGEGRIPALREVIRSPVLGMAAIVGTCIGIAGLFQSFVGDNAGVFPAFITLLVGLTVLPIVSLFTPGEAKPEKVILKHGILLGFTSSIAFMLAAVAYQRGSAAVITALICLCPGVSIFIAWKLLREKVAFLQIVGGAFGIITVIMFALSS